MKKKLNKKTYEIIIPKEILDIEKNFIYIQIFLI